MLGIEFSQEKVFILGVCIPKVTLSFSPILSPET